MLTFVKKNDCYKALEMSQQCFRSKQPFLETKMFFSKGHLGNQRHKYICFNKFIYFSQNVHFTKIGMN